MNDLRALILHIPKTAGTTLRHLALQNYRPSEVFLSYPSPLTRYNLISDWWRLHPNARRRIRLVMGHVALRTTGCIPAHYQRVTFLRDPVARVLSRYKHHAREELRSGRQPLSIEAFLSGPGAAACDNGQLRSLAWRRPPARGSCTTAMLDDALEALETGFAAVGLVERFDESLQLVATRLGWAHRRYETRNEARIAVSGADPALLSRIAEMTQLDAELYRYAQARLDRDCAALAAGGTPAVLRLPFADSLAAVRTRLVASREQNNRYRKALLADGLLFEPSLRSSVAAGPTGDIIGTLSGRRLPAAGVAVDVYWGDSASFTQRFEAAQGAVPQAAGLSWTLPARALRGGRRRCELVLRSADADTRMLAVHVREAGAQSPFVRIH